VLVASLSLPAKGRAAFFAAEGSQPLPFSKLPRYFATNHRPLVTNHSPPQRTILRT
jgi:hypothetical protein